MAEQPLVLGARAGQEAMVAAVCDQVEVSGVVNPGRSRLRGLAAPVFDDWDHLRRHLRPAACCFMAPYARLKQDLLACVDEGVHVLAAGPVSLTRTESDGLEERARERQVHVRFGGAYRFSPTHRALADQSRNPSFGSPVYLRQIRGGGPSLLSAWWAACEGLDQAQELLDAEIRQLHVAACRRGRAHHIAVTGAFSNRAHLQLVVAPAHPPLYPYCRLLGTGGLLTSPGAANAPLVLRGDQASLQPHPGLAAEPAWVADFMDEVGRPAPPLPPGPTGARHGAILRAARQALRQARPVGVSL